MLLLTGVGAAVLAPVESASWSDMHPAEPTRTDAGRLESPGAPVEALEGHFVPLVVLELPPAKTEAPVAIVETVPHAAIVLDLPPVAPAPVPREPARPPLELAAIEPRLFPAPDVGRPETPTLLAETSSVQSPARIEQLTEPGQSAVPMAQLAESGEYGATHLVDRIAAMQVAVPPSTPLTDEERAVMLAGAPDELLVRAGERAVGKVAFRMTDERVIAVQLSGLLDLVSGAMDPEDYDRLRHSSAAGSFVPLDQLREAGIAVRYDPVYDELQMAV